jgi:hypothetical protein
MHRPDVQAIRKIMIDLILATDMKQHFALLGHFQNTHQAAVGAVKAHSTAGHQKEETDADNSSLGQGQSQKAAAVQDHTLSLQV